MDISHIIILFGISIAQIVTEQPRITVRHVYLNRSEAEKECRNSGLHLINFLDIKNRIESINKSELKVDLNYWVADTWIPKMFFVKGCRSKVKSDSTRIFQENLFSECVTYCQKQNFTTIGIQGSNCSCIADDTPQNIGSNNCDLECAWNNSICRAEKYLFGVYQLAEGLPFSLGGKVLDDCVYFQQFGTKNFFVRGDCKEKNGFICQNGNKNYIVNKTMSTWIEANWHCSKENMTLANLNDKNPWIPNLTKEKRYWIGIRQLYMQQTEMESSICSSFKKYNPKGDIYFYREDCSKIYSYICVQDPASTTSSINIVSNTKYQMGHSSETAMHAQELGFDRNESGPAVIAGVVAGIIGTVALIILIVVCLFLRIRKKNPRSKYISPTVTFSSTSSRDSKISQDRSVKATPLKPARRSKKSNPASLAEGTAYENIVLTLEDPATISRVVSSSSTEQKQDVKDVESSYDVMGAFKTNNNTASVSQNVYGFSVPDNEYDVMDRGIRHTEEVNPDYDHM